MPAVEGDWVENFTEASTTREVSGRQLSYTITAATGSLSIAVQAFVGNKWGLIETLTGVTSGTKFFESNKDRQFRAVATGTGTATLILSPDTHIQA